MGKRHGYYPVYLLLAAFVLVHIFHLIVFAEESISKGSETGTTSSKDIEADSVSKGIDSIPSPSVETEGWPASKEKRAVLPPVLVVGKKPGPGTTVAILPFQNLSGRYLLIDDIVMPFYQSLENIYSLVPYEDVDEAILQLRLRHTGFLTSEEASKLGERLGAEALILGMICDYQDTPDPRIGLIVKMIGTQDDAPVIWMKSAVASGNQMESWFGTNRILKTDHLVEEVVKDLIKDIPVDSLKKNE
ncbi:hypothetical protein JXL19_05265 [bacterium]|nr:hypothetical protein [bacterium]